MEEPSLRVREDVLGVHYERISIQAGKEILRGEADVLFVRNGEDDSVRPLERVAEALHDVDLRPLDPGRHMRVVEPRPSALLEQSLEQRLGGRVTRVRKASEIRDSADGD